MARTAVGAADDEPDRRMGFHPSAFDSSAWPGPSPEVSLRERRGFVGSTADVYSNEAADAQRYSRMYQEDQARQRRGLSYD